MPLVPMPDRVVLADMPLEPDPHWWRQWTTQPGDHTRSHTEVLGPGAPAATVEVSPQAALLLERATALSLPAADTNALIQLRDYQRECVAAVADAWWKRNVQRPLIVLPCAAGKTIIAAELIRIFHQQSLGERVLFLAHRKVLLDQTAEKLRLVSPATRVGVVQAKHNDLGREVTVASIQTLGHRSRKRLQQLLDHGPYGLIILDEAHHSTSEQHETVLRALAEANPRRLLLGLTATPGRADGTALDTVFDEIVFERNLFDMISLGWLVPPRGFRVHLDVDLDQVESENGDFVTAQLSKVMNTPQVNTAVVHAWMRYGMDRKFLVFTVDVAHARDLAQEFRDAGYTAAVLTAGTKEKEREKIYAQFRAGEVKLLLSCEVLTEGYDEPSAEGVLFARPTQSQSFMIQAAGRAMRLYPGKTEAIIIDCVGNTERHQLVQLATLAGFEPELPLEGDGEPELDEEAGDGDSDPTVLSADIRGEEFSFHARQARTRYQWRETGVGWILQVPKIGYYLVAWSDRARQRATIRFYDQRKGRRDTVPREVCTQPIAFEIAYSMVEAEMDRIFNARSNRRNDQTDDVEDAPDISFVDFDDGLEEPTEIPEEWILRGAEWRDARTSERQRSLLTKLGAKRTTMPETAGEASDLIVILQVEWDVTWREPATPKQLAYIHVNGLDYKTGMTKKAAARQIWKHRKAAGR